MTTLFISDLHLSHERPEKLELFLGFLAGPARQADSLYILGDFFEAWIGDDYSNDAIALVLNSMKQASQAGLKIFVMHGNRDFLLGESFAELSGSTLLPDPFVLDLYGVKTLLMHGDLLCTQDVEYLKFRQMVRNPAWQQDFLSKPIEERLMMAQQLRAASKEAMKDKVPVIMDAEQETIDQFMREHQVFKLIHGHTHRPAVHNFELDAQPATRTVLGDWYQNENVLICSDQGQQLSSIQSFLNE